MEVYRGKSKKSNEWIIKVVLADPIGSDCSTLYVNHILILISFEALEIISRPIFMVGVSNDWY